MRTDTKLCLALSYGTMYINGLLFKGAPWISCALAHSF